MNTTNDFSVRLMQIDRVISEKGVVSFEELQRVTGAAPATVKRDLRYMREKLKAPIVFSRIRGGYLFAKNRAEAKSDEFDTESKTFVRKSSWFTPYELYHSVKALNAFGVIEQNRKGFMNQEIRQVSSRLRAVMFEEEANVDELKKRVLIQEPVRKPIVNDYFEVLGQALVHRQRLRIRYWDEAQQKEVELILSPMRMVYHRGCWYLDAWCHDANALQSFNVEYVRHAYLMQGGVKPIPMKAVDEALGAAYGIFRGEKKMARLRFTGEAATRASRWVWHEEQVGSWMGEDVYELVLPFAEPTQALVGDILQYGAGCEVMEPQSLKVAIKEELKKTLAKY